MTNFNTIFGALALGAFAIFAAPAVQAATITEMIGDDDGYGIGIPDGGDTTPFAVAGTDNRDASEAAATNGAQLTDVYSSLFPGFGPNMSEMGSFIFSPLAGNLTSATLTIDMADFQASDFGAIMADINGVSLDLAFDDGFQNSAVRDFTLSAAQLAAVNADGFLSLNLDHTGSNDFIAFDYVKLTGDIDMNVVPVPASLPLLAAGLGLLRLTRRRRTG